MSDLVLFDNNVWVEFARCERSVILELEEAAQAAHVSIAVYPPTVRETMDGDWTQEHIRLDLVMRGWMLSQDSWVQLMPDGYYEAVELVLAIKRHRPAWLFDVANVEIFRMLESSYRQNLYLAKYVLNDHRDPETNQPVLQPALDPLLLHEGHWEQLRRDPIGFAKSCREIHTDDVQAGRSQTEEMRTGSDANENQRKEQFIDRLGEPGWRRTSAETLNDRFYVEVRSGDPFGSLGMTDWISPLADMRILIQYPLWERFWLEQIEPRDVPHAWVRAHALSLQARRLNKKAVKGFGGDNQLVGALPLVDHIVTTDTDLLAVVDELNDFDPPFDLPESHEATSGSAPDAVFQLLENLRAIG